ncbi:protein Frey 1 [Mixophyes fleayi]|uniref:protein Frey 1 n=1 Tax=Mixophyes fleayi TaxID=3061075 RepID=UPI003F4DB685
MCDRHCVVSVLCFLLLMDLVPCFPILQRVRRYIPLDFEAPLEMPVEHFGLVDDYGVQPKHPALIHRVTRKKPEGLLQARKSKRDEPDIGELYYDDFM